MRTLYRAGAVYSPAAPSTTAFVVDDGTIAWLGPRQDAPGVREVDAVVDLDDCRITPGFVDSHAHVTETGLLLAGLDLQQARSVTEILALVDAARGRVDQSQDLGDRT